MSSLLDKQVEVSPSLSWGPAWLDRTFPAYIDGADTLSSWLSMAMAGLGLATFFSLFFLQRKISSTNDNPSNRSELRAKLEIRAQIISRGQFYIALIYLLCTFLVAGVDAYISFLTLRDDLSTHSEFWNTKFLLELGGYTLLISLSLIAIFLLVPLLEVFFSFCLLAHYIQNRTRTQEERGNDGSDASGDLKAHLPLARAWSTLAAQLWSLTCFYIQLYTPATEDRGVWCWVLLLAAVGSSVVWLDVSYLFNFQTERLLWLETRELDLSSSWHAWSPRWVARVGGVAEVVGRAGKTVWTLHGRGEKQVLLPGYATVPQEEMRSDEEKMDV